MGRYMSGRHLEHASGFPVCSGRPCIWHAHPKTCPRNRGMKTNLPPFPKRLDNSGKIGWIFLWLIGIPVPVLLILFLLRGCT